jgi:hypothetical protein
VRCVRAAHNDGEDVDFRTWPVVTYGVCEGVYLSLLKWAVWERLCYVQYFYSLI